VRADSRKRRLTRGGLDSASQGQREGEEGGPRETRRVKVRKPGDQRSRGEMIKFSNAPGGERLHEEGVRGWGPGKVRGGGGKGVRGCGALGKEWGRRQENSSNGKSAPTKQVKTETNRRGKGGGQKKFRYSVLGDERSATSKQLQ